MPRTIIEPQFTIEHLSILDSDGNLDSALDPGIPPDELKRLVPGGSEPSDRLE